MSHVWRLVCLALVVATLSSAHRPTRAKVEPVQILVAGVPKYLSETASDQALFAALGNAGISHFLPFFQYQEVPESLSLDRQDDFFPPCEAGDEPFASMESNGVGLVLPGQLLWPPGQDPSIGDNYIRQFIECAGAGGISAVFSVDEPAFHMEDIDAREDEVRLIYERSKVLLPDVPVVMVHGPIVNETLDGEVWRPFTTEEAERYLNDVARLSVWADIVGFDLYMIPSETAKISAPGFGVEVLDFRTAYPAYLDWLATELPDKQSMLVLQAFGYAHLVGIEPDASSREPTADEILGMACVTWDSGADVIGWWGQSHLESESAPLWDAIVEVSRGLVTDPETICRSVTQ